MQEEIKEIKETIESVLAKFNHRYTLQVVNTIQITPNKIMEEETVVTPEVTETAPEVVEEVVAETLEA